MNRFLPGGASAALCLSAAACAALCLPAAALAQTDAAPDAADGNFRLGEIIVTGTRAQGLAIGDSGIDQQAIDQFGRARLDEAVNLIPGVVTANSGGSRNERLIFVRGFDRFQVPLSIDGIRIYLPADNRLDFARFLTADVAQVQVAKGYASVLDGPGAMGGAINLVTRKPTKALEIDLRGELDLDRDVDYAGYNVFGLIGTKQDRWYAQASFTRSFTDHWTLPGGFTALVPANEDGGERDFSGATDWRVNAKIGFTPNATDEYSLSYTRQEGSKNAPLHISDTSNASLRNWSWPYWDIESFYFLSTTALSEEATLKTRAYYSSYDNMLRAWDDRNQDSQTLGRAFDSPYSDTAYGGSLELGVDLLPADRLTIAFHYRHDEHKETQTSRPDVAGSAPEPVQVSAERTWSMAAENRLALSPALALTLGISYDWRDLDRAEEYSSDLGIYGFPLRNVGGVNGQGRLDWTGADGSTAHLSISSRVRFPTLFERFSSQFGTAVPNPGLSPERATNVEIGGARAFGPVQASAAIFYSRLTDALVSVRTPDNLNRRENYGTADYYGAELSLDATLGATLQLGANYSYIHRDFDVGTPPDGGLIRPFRLTDVPKHKGLVYLSWAPVPSLRIVPSIEAASDRMTVTPASANGVAPVYYETGSYVLGALKIDYDVTPNVTLGLGMRNAFDDYYTLTDGFPEAGRSFFLTARARY